MRCMKLRITYQSDSNFFFFYCASLTDKETILKTKKFSTLASFFSLQIINMHILLSLISSIWMVENEGQMKFLRFRYTWKCH